MTIVAIAALTVAFVATFVCAFVFGRRFERRRFLPLLKREALDVVGDTVYGLTRTPGESEASYRERLRRIAGGAL